MSRPKLSVSSKVPPKVGSKRRASSRLTMTKHPKAGKKKGKGKEVEDEGKEGGEGEQEDEVTEDQEGQDDGDVVVGQTPEGGDEEDDQGEEGKEKEEVGEEEEEVGETPGEPDEDGDERDEDEGEDNDGDLDEDEEPQLGSMAKVSSEDMVQVLLRKVGSLHEQIKIMQADHTRKTRVRSSTRGWMKEVDMTVLNTAPRL